MQKMPVVEREAELAALSTARKRAGAGRGGWIAVTGPAGIGKTCLLEQVVTDAAAAGWFVLSTRSRRARPGHSLVLGLLDGLDAQAHPLDGPARALRTLRAGASPTTRDLALGLRWLLEDLSVDRPVLLVADDLQWADALSLRVLRSLRDTIRGISCLVVVGVTDEPRGSTHAVGTSSLVAEVVDDARRLAPAPLTRAAVAGVVRALRTGASDHDVDRLYAGSRGSPGDLAALLAAGHDAAPTIGAGFAGEQRTAGERAGEPAAPADPSPGIATAMALAGRSRAAGRVRSLALRSARDAAGGALPADSLLLATALLTAVSAFDEAERLLTGLVDDPADEQRLLVAAACRGHVRVRMGLVNEGLADLQPTGALAPAGSEQTAADLSAVIEGRLARGEVPEAAALATLLVDTRLPVGLGAALAQHCLGEVASATGENTRAIALYQEADRRAGAGIDNPALLPWRVGAAFAEIRTGRPGRALVLARENLRLAQRFGAPYAEVQALRTLAAVDVTAGRIGLLRQALDLARSVPAHRLRTQIETDLAALLMLTHGQESEAITLLHGADRFAVAQELWPLQARARRLLVRLGEAPPRRHVETLSTLTTSERRTARLAAEGRTNRQIAERVGVSVKAVEWHLSGCYRKLGIRSRRQLPAALGAA